jgi:hypothetical protein
VEISRECTYSYYSRRRLGYPRVGSTAGTVVAREIFSQLSIDTILQQYRYEYLILSQIREFCVVLLLGPYSRYRTHARTPPVEPASQQPKAKQGQQGKSC